MLKLIATVFTISFFINLVYLQAEQLELYEQHKKNAASTFKKKTCLVGANFNKKNIKDVKDVVAKIQPKAKDQIVPYSCPTPHTNHIRKIKKDVLSQINQLKNKKIKQARTVYSYSSSSYEEPHTSVTLQPNERKTKYSVVLMHGLFMTPRQMDETQKVYTSMGFNVINLRLPGHGTKNYKGLKNIQWENWDKEMKESLKLAQKLGDKVLVSGHSTGGLLAYKAGLDYAHSPKNNTAIHGIINFSPALKTSTRSDTGSYFGTIANAFFPNVTEYISHLPPEPGVEVNQLGKHLINKYAVKTNQKESDPYSSDDFTNTDWDKERIKEMYSKLKNIPILQVDSKHDSFVDYAENQQVMHFLKKQNTTLHVKKNSCLISIFKSQSPHMLSPLYLNQYAFNLVKKIVSSNKNRKSKSALASCMQKFREDQLKVLKFIDKNFPGRCD